MTQMTQILKIPESFLSTRTKENFREKTGKASFPSLDTPANRNISTHERAAAYVASIPAAVSGQGGHVQTFSVARSLAHGFALPPADAWPILMAYGARCLPPWSIDDLRHKLADAEKPTGHPKPKGHLLKNAAPFGVRTVSLPHRETPRPVPTFPATIGRISLPADLVIRKRGEVPPDPAAELAPVGWCSECWWTWSRALRPGSCICTGDVAIRPGHPKKAMKPAKP